LSFCDFSGHHVMNIEPSDYHSQMKLEMKLCSCAADRYPCNYYAWSHRIWLLQNAYNCATQVIHYFNSIYLCSWIDFNVTWRNFQQLTCEVEFDWLLQQIDWLLITVHTITHVMYTCIFQVKGVY